MAKPAASNTRSDTLFEMRALESLPCGCVAVAYEARALGVVLVSVEAKGPHCVLPEHDVGMALQLGDLTEFEREVDLDSRFAQTAVGSPNR